jgi:hypothetical protein
VNPHHPDAAFSVSVLDQRHVRPPVQPLIFRDSGRPL